MDVNQAKAVVVLPFRLDEKIDGVLKCNPDEADFFSLYIEDLEGELHNPEEIGLQGHDWDFTDRRTAEIVATWVSAGLPCSGGAQ